MAIFPIELENLKAKGSPLTPFASHSLVTYTKDNFNTKGVGYPTEQFVIVDPTLYGNRMPNEMEDPFSAVVTILRNEDGSAYPQFEINAGYDSFTVWDGTERLGTNTNALYTVDQLNRYQLAQYTTVVSIMKETLPTLCNQSPTNTTLAECATYFDCMEQTQTTKPEQPTQLSIDDDFEFDI